jgi:hypothetical protein
MENAKSPMGLSSKQVFEILFIMKVFLKPYSSLTLKNMERTSKRQFSNAVANSKSGQILKGPCKR